jgi:hypothetical protein
MNEAPAWLKEIFETRRGIGDPVTADFVFIDKLPKTAPPNTAHTAGNGVYKFYNGVEWREYGLKFSDGYVRGLLEGLGRVKAAVKLVDNLIARIDPADYLTSGNAGGQSVSFPSLRDVLDYYNALRDRLLEEEAAAAGMNSGRMLQTKRRPVGGVLEGDDYAF